MPFGNTSSHDNKIVSGFSTSQSAASVSTSSTHLPKKQVSQNALVVPAIPPSKPGPSSHKSPKTKQLVITETVSKIVVSIVFDDLFSWLMHCLFVIKSNNVDNHHT